MYDEKDKDGQVVTRFHQVCAMRMSENGNLIMNIPRGMSISGKVLIKEVKEKKLSENDDVDSDLPF